MTLTKTIAVTAATGRLGSATLRALKTETDPANLVAIARRPDRVSVSGVGTRPGDYADKVQMIEAFDGIDTVVMRAFPTCLKIDGAS